MRHRSLFAAALLMLAASGIAAAEGETATSRGFRGRSGATKLKIVVVCGIPDPDANAQGGFVPGLAARIKEATPQKNGYRLDEKRLRELAVQWSGQGPPERVKNMEELLRTVPPKYHATVKEYFEKLEREAKKK